MLNANKTGANCLSSTHQRQSLSSLTRIQVGVFTSNYLASLLLTISAAKNMFHTSVQYPTYISGLVIKSAHVLILSAASQLPVQLWAPGMITQIPVYLESPVITFIDYNAFKLLHPHYHTCSHYHAYHRITNTPRRTSLTSYPSTNHSQTRLSSRSLHETSTVYKSSLLNAYATTSLWSTWPLVCFFI